MLCWSQNLSSVQAIQLLLLEKNIVIQELNLKSQLFKSSFISLVSLLFIYPDHLMFWKVVWSSLLFFLSFFLFFKLFCFDMIEVL